MLSLNLASQVHTLLTLCSAWSNETWSLPNSQVSVTQFVGTQ